MANLDPPHIAILGGDLTEVARLPLPAPAVALRFSADGAGLYAALAPDSGSTIVAHTGRGPTALSPRLPGTAVGLLTSRDSRTLYLALNDRGGERGGGVGFLDAGTLRERRRLRLCERVETLAMAPDGDRLYLSCGVAGIAEVDANLETTIRMQPLAGCEPGGLGVSRAGAILVTCGTSARVWLLDARTLAPFDSLILPEAARLLRLTARRNRALGVTAARLLLLDPVGRALVGTVATPSQVTHLAIAGDQAYAATGRTLVAFSWQTGRVIRSVPLPAPPLALAAWPGPREPRLVWFAR